MSPLHVVTPASTQGQSKPRFVLEPVSEIKPNLKTTWLIKGLLPSDGLSVIYGPPGCGKSFIALDMALHVAAGRLWAGGRVRPTGVIYIAGEGGSGFRNRIVAARARQAIPDNVPFFLITVAPNLGVGTDDAKALIACIKQQIAQLGDCEIGLVIIDTLARSMSGADESSARDMGLFVENAGFIERELRALVVAVHHTGKDSDRGMRGSSALHGATNAEWEIGKNDGARFLRVAKQKDGKDGARYGFQVAVATLGNDQDGDPVTTLVVEVATAPTQPESAPLSRYKAGVLEALRMAIDNTGRVPCADADGRIGPTLFDGQLCVTREDIEDFVDLLELTASTNARSRRAMLNKRLREWEGEGAIASSGEWYWIPIPETSKQDKTN